MYGKIFDSMYEGTLYGHWEAIVTLQQMIVLASADGVVDMTPQAIAARTSIPLEIITKGIGILSEPDPYSRTPGEEGRRIGLIDAHRPWGWYIVNHNKYRSLQDMDTIREQTRERVRRHREQKRTVTEGNGQKRHTDADTNTNTEKSSVAQALHPTALPLRKGEELKIPESLIEEWSKIYPKVDIPATILEMRGWCLSNPSRLKTRRGALRFVNNWLRTAQEEYAQS
jgi:hypothetical protein